jgi:uncharacterized membrane protein
LQQRITTVLPARAGALARSVHPMFIAYTAALAGAALIFDILYLASGAGAGLAAVSTAPIVAGLVAGLVAAADELRLDRRTVRLAAATTVAAGFANMTLLGAVGSMLATGPSDWRTGALAVSLSAVGVFSCAVTGWLGGCLATSLGGDPDPATPTLLPLRGVVIEPADRMDQAA